MSGKHSARDQQMRYRLAQEAARIILESGLRDFRYAKQKAAEHLDAADTRNLPNNLEIEQAIEEYQRLFRAESQPRHLRRMRETALEAMQFFKDFSPRLVGPVASGSADEHSAVTLHLFADNLEAIDMKLIDHRIPYELISKRIHWRSDEYESIVAYTFYVDDVRIEALVFNDRQRQAPLSPVDGRPYERLTLKNVEALLATENPAALAVPGDDAPRS
ncbi:MAG: hypothetical protein R6X06_03905 [Gammaproteobacteria bacterium]